jgi:hypothetical protein
MRIPSFKTIIENQFLFLVSDYNFHLIKSYSENWGCVSVYLNNVVGVKITYEYREAYLFIMLYKLIDGKLVENPIKINLNSDLNGYSLDDVIKLRNPADLVKPAYEYGSKSEFYDEKNGLTLFVSIFANNLKKYASDILHGDFSLFEKLDIIVKDRVKNIP